MINLANISATISPYIPSAATAKATVVTALTSKVALGIFAAVVLTYATIKLVEFCNEWAAGLSDKGAPHEAPLRSPKRTTSL